MVSKRTQKNPCVRKISARNSGAGNGCANFMGAWKNAFFLQEEAMSIKFLVFFLGGGGGYFGLFVKNLLTTLFVMGCFPVDFQEAKRLL